MRTGGRIVREKVKSPQADAYGDFVELLIRFERTTCSLRVGYDMFFSLFELLTNGSVMGFFDFSVVLSFPIFGQQNLSHLTKS
jgi:hypothetical protein